MKRLILVAALMAFLTGCATSQQVLVGQIRTQQQKLTTAALVPQDGNSPEMDSQIQQQLITYGITMKSELPAGTRQSKDVDMLVTYTDHWYWDVVMYLKSITVNFYDASTGNLLVSGRWDNSAFHSFPKSQDVIRQLLDEMHLKLTSSSATTPPPSPALTAPIDNPTATGKLKELDSMHAQGLITDAEYQQKRKQVLNNM